MGLGLGLGLGVGAGAGICLELEPKPEISKMGGSGNPALGETHLRLGIFLYLFVAVRMFYF